jgi:hypothetical protein
MALMALEAPSLRTAETLEASHSARPTMALEAPHLMMSAEAVETGDSAKSTVALEAAHLRTAEAVETGHPSGPLTLVAARAELAGAAGPVAVTAFHPLAILATLEAASAGKGGPAAFHSVTALPRFGGLLVRGIRPSHWASHRPGALRSLHGHAASVLTGELAALGEREEPLPELLPKGRSGPGAPRHVARRPGQVLDTGCQRLPQLTQADAELLKAEFPVVVGVQLVEDRPCSGHCGLRAAGRRGRRLVRLLVPAVSVGKGPLSMRRSGFRPWSRPVALHCRFEFIQRHFAVLVGVCPTEQLLQPLRRAGRQLVQQDHAVVIRIQTLKQGLGAWPFLAGLSARPIGGASAAVLCRHALRQQGDRQGRH